MSTTTTRRAVIAASVTLPLLPVASYAQPGDPAVAAYRKWLVANEAYERSFGPPDVPDDDPVMIAASDAALAANLALCDTVATTPEGLAGQVHLPSTPSATLSAGKIGSTPTTTGLTALVTIRAGGC